MNMKIKKLNIKDINYFIKINIFIFLAVLITFPQSYSKPIPPGSGEGDVPANILFLLDSSLSMKNPVTGGTYLGLSGVDWAVELSDGNLIVGEKGDGAVKILTAESKKDTSFANGNINFTGKAKDSTCDNSPTGKKALKKFLDMVYGNPTKKYVVSDTFHTKVVLNNHGDSGGVRGAAWL